MFCSCPGEHGYVLLDGPTVQLYRVGDVAGPGPASYAPWVGAADAVTVGAVLGLGVLEGRALRARRRSRVLGV